MDVVGGDEDVAEEPVRKAPVKKSVAFVVGADDEKDDSTYEGKTHHDGEAEDGDTLGVESKQAERPAMSEVLGEAEPVKQPSARERRMADAGQKASVAISIDHIHRAGHRRLSAAMISASASGWLCRRKASCSKAWCSWL